MLWILLATPAAPVVPLPDVDEPPSGPPAQESSENVESATERDSSETVESATESESEVTETEGEPTNESGSPRKEDSEEEPDIVYGTRQVVEPGAVESPSQPAASRPPPQPKPPPSPEAIARDGTIDLSPPKKTRKLWRPEGSPQRFALELKFGPYLPEVDRNYTGEGLGPYARVFGRTNDMGEATDEPRAGMITFVSFEYQFYYVAGPFSVGLQAGFFRDTAQALVEPDEPGDSFRSEADKVSFSMVPLALLVGYRFEMAADRWKVPLVPYFRTGINYGFWWSRDGNGDISRNEDGEKGHGGTWGWQLNAGGMLRLDFIERGSAKKLDIQTGINHTYLFAEYQLARMTGFGNDAAMSIGDSTYLIGLAMEF